MSKPDDSTLTSAQRARVRKEAERALREAGALGVFPTPVNRIMEVAKVQEVQGEVLGESFLSKMRAKAGSALKRALSKVLGLFHASEGLIFIDQTMYAVKKRFVRLHESAHGFLPWQRPMYAVVEDCEKSLTRNLRMRSTERRMYLRPRSSFSLIRFPRWPQARISAFGSP